MEQPRNKRVLSGVQPSGTLHIGNYLGALKQWVALQTDNDCYYCIVDEHAITVPYEPQELPDRVLNTAAWYLAAGLDPNKSVIFVQSHVPAHTEMAWLLSTITPYGELTRMTQFKDKAKKQSGGTSVGLFAYPVLMAADILLYHAEVVPVGEDQVQHLELARQIAERFNKRFGEIFTVPKPFLPDGAAARVMSLTDPEKKMSKSDPTPLASGELRGAGGVLFLHDSSDVIRKKIMSAVTETEPVFSFSQSGPAVKNLLAIYENFSGKTRHEIEREFTGKGYKEFKEALVTVVTSALAPMQEQYRAIRANDDELRILLGRGSHRATHVATQTLTRAKEAMGLL